MGACGSRWLLLFCDQLADQHHRYRRLSAPRAFAERGVKGEHQQLLEVALAGHADKAVALLSAHFERIAKVIREDPDLFSAAAWPACGGTSCDDRSTFEIGDGP
ncbi:MAG: FCD domain-containing protein [Burkholderiaceae bacterium]